nr:hypothetical protein [Tanacetum cinerariifolium]
MTPEAVRAIIDQAMQRNSTNGDGSHSSEGGPTRPIQSVRACSYSNFIKCQPLNFRGTEGVVGHDASYAMTWETLKKKLTDKYCPKDETKKVDKYISGLLDNIHGNVMSVRPKTLDEAIELADKFVRDPNKTPDSSQRPPHDCPKCGNQVDGLYCRRCALSQNKLKEVRTPVKILHKVLHKLTTIVVTSMESSTPLRDIIISKLPPCIAITPVLSTKETKDSLIMGDEYLDTISEKESDKFLKSSVENFVPNPSESENKLISDEDVPKEIYSNLLFDDEIISIKIDPHHFNAESDLIESLLNQDSLTISSSKIDSLLDEFAGELIFLKSIPLGINEADCDPEEEIRLIEKLLYHNSSFSENSDVVIKSFSPSLIPVEDSDPFIEEIDLFLTSDGSIPPGIDSDYSNSEGDNLFLERFLHDDPIPLLDILYFSNVVRVFLPFFTYPVTSSILLSSGSEDTIFDHVIFDHHFSSFMLGVSHRCGTFMKFNGHPNHLNKSPMEILSSTYSLIDQ